jgi:tyrosine-protein phosphatase SIW14
VYRSSYPTKKTLPFLKRIGVRSIVYLCLEEYTDGGKKFLEENNIRLFPHGTPGNNVDLAAFLMMLRQHLGFSLAGNKEPFDRIDETAIYSALQVRQIRYICHFSSHVAHSQTLLDVNNHPVVVHCNKVRFCAFYLHV